MPKTFVLKWCNAINSTVIMSRNLHRMNESQSYLDPRSPHVHPGFVKETTSDCCCPSSVINLSKLDLQKNFSAWRHCSSRMCGSRKYPYPPTEGFFQFAPPPPRIFHFRGLHVTPPTPWNFHDFSTWSLLPPGNSKSTNKEISLIYFLST